MTSDRHAGTTRAWRAPGALQPGTVSGRGTALAGLALAAMWVVAALFHVLRPAPGPLDLGWDALMTRSGDSMTHGIAATLAVIGTGLPASAIAVVLGVLIGAVRGWGWAVFVVVASSVSAFDVAGMKSLAMRARPDPAYGFMNAFPSGHTANAALLGSVVFLLVRHVAARCLAVAWFVAMAWSRTALHAHWLTDVLAAIIVGAATAVLLLATWQRALLLRRRLRAGSQPMV